MSAPAPPPSATGFRLSPLQRALWPLARGTGAPRALAWVRVTGRLDRDRLERAVAEVVARHEILRTRFRLSAELDLPLQDVGEPDPDTPVAWREVPDRDLEAEVAARWEALRRLDLDPADGPVFRLEALAGREASGLLFVVPALCCDAAGLAALTTEVASTYGGSRRVEPPLQYPDVAEWLNQLLSGEEAEAERLAWARRLAASGAVDPVLEAPRSTPHEGVAGGVARSRRTWDLAATERLAASARELDLPLATVVAACWHLLLGRHTPTGTAQVGHVLPGRSYDGLAPLPALLERVVPLAASNLPGEPLGALGRRLSEALEVARTVQEYLEPPAPASAPVAAFQWLEAAPPTVAGGCRFILVEREDRCVPFRLRLRAGVVAGRLELALESDPARVAPLAVHRLLRGLDTALTRVASWPAIGGAAVAALPPEERHAAVVEANDTGVAPPFETFDALFLRQAAATPLRPALAGGGEEWTYAEVERRSRGLAARLRTVGVGPEVPVPVLLERGPTYLLAMLAVLRAGGAFVPLDPVMGEARLAALLSELQAPVAVVSEDLAHHLAGRVAVVVGPDDAEPEPGPWEPPAVHPESLFCIYHTSGSTGRPKAVAVEHRQIVAYVRGIQERLSLGGSAGRDGAADGVRRFATLSTFAADLGNTAIFPMLAGGGCVHVVPQELLLDAPGLATEIERHQIDAMKLVPSHLEALLDAFPGPGVLPLRRLVLGGEALPRALVSRVVDRAPGLAVFNHYGPTETTVGVSVHPAHPAADPERTGDVPLGRPNPGSRLYALDHDLSPVPRAAQGELFVGGLGVTRGYGGCPALTAERFLPDPFAAEPGGRMYRTGDRVARGAAGEVRFVDRTDRQVKLRGFRIELGEIEAALAGHPEVRRASVVLRGEPGAAAFLAAFVAPRDGARLEPDALRAFLAARLPEPMVPTVVLPLAKLPLNANGKVDRSALPAVDPRRPSRAAYVSPRSDLERAVAELWQEVLGVDRVGVDDNFFDLGGHSLLVVQVHARLRARLDAELSIVDLFRHPTVRALTERLEGGTSQGTPSLPSMQRRADSRREALRERRRRFERRER